MLVLSHEGGAAAKHQRQRFIGRVLAGLVAGGLVLPPQAPARAQAGDWPCVQRLVGRLEGGQMWAGPPLPVSQAETSPEAEALARELSDLQLAPEALAAKIEAYAQTVPQEARSERLTQLFAAALATLNGQRASIIEGIKRYASRQQRLAEKIAAENRELDALQRSADAEPQGDPARVADLQSARDWDTRVHADRQRQLSLVCDQPVRLEQRAFALARTIQEQLP